MMQKKGGRTMSVIVPIFAAVAVILLIYYGIVLLKGDESK